MSDPQTTGGFGESPQAPFEHANIPTDPEAFLRWNSSLDRHHPYKYELSNGKVSRTMISVSKAHWRVTANILRDLFQKVDRSKFEAGPTELGVRTGTGVRYPDVVVDRASAHVEGLLACEAPILIVEVLSASTVGLDFTVKLREYRTIDSVQAYLICGQDEPRAWIWQREEDGTWPELPTELVGREGKVLVRALGIELTVAALFHDVPDPPSIPLPGTPRNRHSREGGNPAHREAGKT